MNKMLIDMHMHEMTFSDDSHLSLEEMVKIARRIGLDGICITDHDNMGLRDYAKEYSRKVHFPIFVGIEYYSLQGDIVAFGIEHYPGKRDNAQTFVDCVKAQNGVCFSAHPFRNNNRGLGEHLNEIVGLDGVEVLNGSTLPDANQKAADYATALHLAHLGASDCHISQKLGVYATYFPDEIETTQDLVSAIRAGSCMPAYLKGNTYHIWDSLNQSFREAGVTPHKVVEYTPDCAGLTYLDQPYIRPGNTLAYI